MRAFLIAATAAALLSGCSKPEDPLNSEAEVVKGALSLQFMASKAVYDYGEPMNFELTLTNDSQDTIRIQWPHMGGPRFEADIFSRTGELVWTRRDDGPHLLIAVTTTLWPGSYTGDFWTVFDTLDAGRYTATGWPVCDRELIARIGFRIRPEK